MGKEFKGSGVSCSSFYKTAVLIAQLSDLVASLGSRLQTLSLAQLAADDVFIAE